MSGPEPIVWLDGGLREPGTAALGIGDPAVRWGEGLFETMRAERGRIALQGAHLDRLERSARALGLSPVPGRDEIAAALAEVLGAIGPGPARVRLSVSPRPTLLIEAAPEDPLPTGPPAQRAIALPGAWVPGNRAAEHKTLSHAAWRLAQRRAERAGAEHALLLDDAGRLGEAAVASAVCRIGERVLSAPPDGLLAGVALGAIRGELELEERAPERERWRAADEIVLTNAVRGAMAVVEVDGAPIGTGRPGPLAARMAALLREALGAG